jgi:NAD(P)-dependent dehydrogenase (short-subunit alcohol dehydrogenase family)
VRTAAAAVLEEVKANGIDVFIADAGITNDKDGHQPNITDDGFESVVEVNYLGHFLLIQLLLPTIERATWSGGKTQKPRVLSISSEASFDACTWALRPAMCLNATNLHHVVTSHVGGNCTAIGVNASNYGVTKIFQVYHMQHMATATSHGGKVDFYSLHPGFVDTPMTRSIAPATKKAWCQNSHPCPLSAEEGAATPAYLASTPSTKVDIPSGDYVYFCASHVKAAWPSVNADPVQAAADLYTQSQHWVQPHAAPLMTTPSTFPYASWSAAIKQGSCSATSTPLAIDIVSKSGAHAVISCALLPFTHGDGISDDGALPPTIKAYAFPVGVFEVDEQLLIPPNVSFTGAANPNAALASPDWSTQTVFLATRGVSDYDKAYCTASDMVTTRIGFVLSSFVTMRDLSYQGVDTIRPGDNGALCGGGAFELKGCAANDCSKSSVNNGGSDGLASQHVTLENLRVNDYFSKEDTPHIGIVQPGNYDGCFEKSGGCCLCKPNSVRASQVGVWVPSTRDGTASGTIGTKHLVIRNFVSTATQADGINLHGAVHDALVENIHISNTGDDTYAVWGAKLNPSNITFRNITAVNPGILRPNWYGDCVATYGLHETVFEDVVCKAPSLTKPFPWNHNATQRLIDTSLLVVHTSFGASYPQGSSITLKGGWRFENLKGEPYRAAEGVVGRNACPPVGKMAWTKGAGESDVVAPFNFPGGAPASNSVQVFTPPAKTEHNRLVPNALGSRGNVKLVQQ